MMVQFDEEKNTQATAGDRETEQPEWRYVETAHGAEVQAGEFTIRLHWKGTSDTNDIRAVARLIAAAPTLLNAVQVMRRSLNGSPTNFSGMLAAHRGLDAAADRALNPKD